MYAIYKSTFLRLFFMMGLMTANVSFAHQTIQINRIPNHGHVRVKGKVTKIFSENEFLIADKSGSVLISTGEVFTYVLIGEVISVTGKVVEPSSFFSKYRQY